MSGRAIQQVALNSTRLSLGSDLDFNNLRITYLEAVELLEKKDVSPRPKVR